MSATTIYKYRRIETPGPNGTILYFRNTTSALATEIAEVDGWYYVSVPDGAVMPEQPLGIDWQSVAMTDELKDRIKSASRHCHLIADRMQQMIRSEYSVEDEQYFARIGIGVALGVYAFQPGEQDALLAFGSHVESVRQWGRNERAALGL